MGVLLDNLLLFGRTLWDGGVAVHHGRIVDAVNALGWIGLSNRTEVHANLRSLLVHSYEDLARFDAAFDMFFRAPGRTSSGIPLCSVRERPKITATALEGAPATVEFGDAVSETSPRPARLAVGAYSATEVSRTKDFADLTPQELAQARRLLMNLRWHLGVRHARRWRCVAGKEVDLRPALRRNLMRGGEIVDLPHRRRRHAPRPVVLIGDVSGSMDRYSRLLLHFLYGLAKGQGRIEGFVFPTRLTRVTRRLRNSSDRRLSNVIRDVQDWGGGTRIGDALRAFNTQWARRVLRNGSVVLIVSDGWDRGDPQLLARELARLGRSCWRLVWVNPLLGRKGYEPLTRGIQAALPHVDDFLPVHNLASLETLASHLSNANTLGRSYGTHRRLRI